MQLEETLSVQRFRDLVRRFLGNVVCAKISASRADISKKRYLVQRFGDIVRKFRGSCGDLVVNKMYFENVMVDVGICLLYNLC